MTKDNFYLDNVFKEKKDYIEYTLNVYKTIYDLPDIKYSGEVSEELFEYVKKRKYFLLLAIYDENGRVYLERNIQEKLYWSLPGGSILKNEDIHSAVRRISKKITEDGISDISVGEIEPIALVENNFTFAGSTYKHFGIAFAARLRSNKNKISNAQGRFVQLNDQELDNINRYANREVAKICQQRTKAFSTEFPENEIFINEKNKWRYWFHRCIFKKVFLPSFLRKKKAFLEKIEKEIGQAKSFIDISCGDNDISHWLAQRHNFNYIVANDISWSQINEKQSDQKKILFTNHNAVYIPFKESSFDVVYCANTLHHISSREELNFLMDGCLRIAKKVIFVEIEKPEDTGLIPHLLNKYWYRGFLKDVGGSYFSQKDFVSLMNDHYSDQASVSFSEFKNIQGRYLIATIEKKMGSENNREKYIEIEEKFSLPEDNRLEKICDHEGYKPIEKSREIDTYFSDTEGEFIKNRTCLRIRKANTKTELTFKGKSHVASSLYAKVEHNVNLNDDETQNFKDILFSLGYSKYVTVDKSRKTFRKIEDGLIKNVSLDSLEKIGCFVEFEILAIAKQWSEKLEELKGELERMKIKFGATSLLIADQPYRDYAANFIAKKIIKKDSLKCLFLDFDGTIIPSEEIFYNSYRRVATKVLGYTPSMDEYIDFELKKSGGLYNYIGSKTISDVSDMNEKDFMEIVYDEYKLSLENIRHNEKVVVNLEAIKKLKNLGLKIALVTSSKKEFVDQILDYFCAQDLFDLMVTRGDVLEPKPSPESYELALKKMGVEASECLVVEDSERGITSAKLAGLNCVAVSGNSIVGHDELEKTGVFVFETLMEIALILNFA